MVRRIGASPEFAGWIALLCCAPFLLTIPVTNDSAWQMWLGRQMLHGANLYTDLVEVNPPLWFWIAVPLAWISEALALPSRIILIGFLLAVIGLSYALCSALIRDWPTRVRAAFAVSFLLVTIPISLRTFTQREHFVLISAIPYALLCSARDEGRKVSPGLATAVGLLSGCGFALKPFFALVPLCLELWLWRTTRRIRPETISVVALAMVYLTAVVMFERDFLASVPIIAAAYPYFVADSQYGFIVPFMLFALATIPLLSNPGRSASFVIAALAFLLAFIMQTKAWGYQALPATGMLVVALGQTNFGQVAWRDAVAFAVGATAVALNARTYDTTRPFTFPVGSSVATLSMSSRPDWPQVESRSYNWPLRAISLWQLAAIDKGLMAIVPLQNQVAKDLRCAPPEYLVVDQSSVVRHFIASSPDLKEILAHYRFDRASQGLELHFLVKPFTSRPRGCREIATPKLPR